MRRVLAWSMLSPGATVRGIKVGITLVASKLCVKPNFRSLSKCW